MINNTMEALSLLDTLLNDWKIIVAAFTIGGLFYQAKVWFKRITVALDNTATTHNIQNTLLDNMNDKLDGLDRRIAKIEGSIEIIQHENNQQAVKIAVLETQNQNNIIEHPVQRRNRRSNNQ
jgi:hypothetical protein